MMIRRNALGHLADWSGSGRDRKPLLIRGARQVGKTTLVRMLADHLDLQLVEINLEKPWPFTAGFADLDVRHTIEAIEFTLDVDIDPERSLIFFDEVQACAGVLPLLRYFHEETPEYRVIATGSLLEFVLAEPAFSMPVGRIEMYHLGPLGFTEFLTGLGETRAAEAAMGFQWGDDLGDAVHEKLSALVRTYCLVGGMPAAVSVFARTGSLREVERTKSQIIETVRLDFNKYRRKTDTDLLHRVFDALPDHLGRKLIYARLARESRTRELQQAVRQLVLAGLVTPVHHSSANGVPLAAERNDRFFKLLALDIGLLLSQLNLLPTELDHVAELELVNKGLLAEQFIGQQLLRLSPPYRSPQLFYWCRESPSASAEVDFLWEAGSRVVPVEVKAGAAGKLRSLHVMVREKNLPLAVRFSSNRPVRTRERRGTVLGPVEFDLVNLPHYFVERLPELIG